MQRVLHCEVSLLKSWRLVFNMNTMFNLSSCINFCRWGFSLKRCLRRNNACNRRMQIMHGKISFCMRLWSTTKSSSTRMHWAWMTKRLGWTWTTTRLTRLWICDYTPNLYQRKFINFNNSRGWCIRLNSYTTVVLNSRIPSIKASDLLPWD